MILSIGKHTDQINKIIKNTLNKHNVYPFGVVFIIFLRKYYFEALIFKEKLIPRMEISMPIRLYQSPVGKGEKKKTVKKKCENQFKIMLCNS